MSVEAQRVYATLTQKNSVQLGSSLWSLTSKSVNLLLSAGLELGQGERGMEIPEESRQHRLR